MALSDLLTHHLRQEVDRANRGDLDTPELEALAPLFERQQDLSVLPRADQLLIETCKTREGTHLYAYPFEGRFVHEGIGFLWASRLTRIERGTITVSVNDYGFELLAPKTYPMAELVEDHSDHLLNHERLEHDLQNALNLSELQRRRFQSIAQIAGLMNAAFQDQAKAPANCRSVRHFCSMFSIATNHRTGCCNRHNARYWTTSWSYQDLRLP